MTVAKLLQAHPDKNRKDPSSFLPEKKLFLKIPFQQIFSIPFAHLLTNITALI